MTDDRRPPDGWETRSIEELAVPKGIAYGVLKPGPNTADGVPMLRVTDVRNGRIDPSAVYRISHSLDTEFKRTKLRGGEVILSIQGSVGRVALVPQDLAGANVSRTLAMIRLREPTLGSWVHRALESPQIQGAIRQMVGGTTRDSLNLRDLRRIEVPIAPEPLRSALIQLVERADLLAGSSNRHLAAAQRAIERFELAVLRAATSGELTSTWREGREVTSPAQLIDELRTSHDKLRSRERVPDSVEASVRDLTTEDSPESWAVAPLKDLCEPGRPITYGILKPGPDIEGGVPYIRVTDFKSGEVITSSLRRTSPGIATEYRRSTLRAGDVLFAIRGTFGYVAVVPPGLAGANITQDTARLSIDSRLSTDFLVCVLRSPDVQSRIARAAKGVAVQGVNIGDLRELLIAVPPRAEQEEIVRRVHALGDHARALRTKVDAAASRTERLAAAVSSKAFRGELTLNGGAGLGNA